MTMAQIRHAIGQKDGPPPQDEMRMALLDEVAEDMRLSKIGLLKIPVHVVAKKIADKTDGQLAPSWFLRQKISEWAAEKE